MGKEAKKQKSQSMFITSFHLFDISMKFFFFFEKRERQGEKVSNSRSKNKKWAYEEGKLTISTFKLLNKKTLMRQIYFNPLVGEVAKFGLPQGTTGIKKIPVPFRENKSKPSLADWKLKPEMTILVPEIGLFRWRSSRPSEEGANLVLTINPSLPPKVHSFLTKEERQSGPLGLYASNIKLQWESETNPKRLLIVSRPRVIKLLPCSCV